MAGEITIPLLPCHSINEMIDFYRALGFGVTYQQSKPNNYAVVRLEDIELHFFSMRDYVPANSYSTCYVRVSDVDALYKRFGDGLRQRYGRIPSAGIPRVIPLKNKSHNVREFIVVDPGGNWIRIGQPRDEIASENRETSLGSPLTPTKLSRALEAAMVLEGVGYYDKAAEKVDALLAKPEEWPIVHRVQTLVFRAGLAITMNDIATARKMLDHLWEIEFDEGARALLFEELDRADELRGIVEREVS